MNGAYNVKLWTDVTTQNTTENNCINWHAQKKKTTSTHCIFKLNASITVHKQGTVSLPQL